MKLRYKCYPCVLDDLAGALELLDVDEEVARKVMEEASEYMTRNGRKCAPPSYYITAVHRMLKRATGIEEPFAELRRRTNELGVEITARLRKETAQLPDAERFRKIALWCVAANHLDTRTAGTGYAFDPENIYLFIEKKVKIGLAVDMVDEFRDAALEAKQILYIHDNVGEVAIDVLLIEEFQKMGAKVTSALRGGPITSDATMDDGKLTGLFDAADEVILAGPDTLGISIEEMSDELAEALKSADLVISKGQANYYVLTEYIKDNPVRVAFLFSTKCDPVAEQFNLKGKKNIVWLNK